MGYHNGKLQVLPVYWDFPNLTIRQLIENWFVGHIQEKVPPYALLENNHVAHIKTEKNKKAGMGKLRMMRFVMRKIKMYAEYEGCWSENKEEWTVEFASTMWEKIGDKHINPNFSGARRAEASWKTVYNNMVKKKLPDIVPGICPPVDDISDEIEQMDDIVAVPI